jgi:phenylpropionate dioxygenase-like ring-hydroxylating dioxygenase large terminal subunit
MINGSGTTPYDSSEGLLGRDAYVSQEIYELELQRVFGRNWLFVGHTSQVPEAHDFFVSRMGTDSVILTRDVEGDVHVLLNTCRHKGMRVCRYDEGNARVFTCPYHAWSYAVDGRLVEAPGQLVGVQQYNQAYNGTLDRSQWGLVRARSETYKGLVFATWDEDAPSLEEYLGDMRLVLDAMLDCRDGRPGGSEALGGVIKWRFNSNWKAASENFIGDPLHGVSHRSVEAVGIGPGGKKAVSRHGMNAIENGRDYSFPRYGHGAFGTEPDHGEVTDPYPEFVAPVGPLDVPEVVERWYRECAQKRKQRLADKVHSDWPTTVGGVFPNMAVHTSFPRTIAVFHPISPTVCEAWRWLLVDADAPQEVKDLSRHHFLRYSGPAGMTEQDDMENWSFLTNASRGAMARKFPYNYQARLYAEHPSDKLREAMVTDDWGTEGGIRSYYRAWSRHLESASWSEFAAASDRELAEMGLKR